MNERRARVLYAALIAALFASVALWRGDLVVQAARATAQTFALGGAARWKLLAEIVLFAAILVSAWRAIPASTRPAHDAAVFVIAAAAGWAAEAWGTQLGLWRYYTAERPPLWIVPAWPLGAALIERLAAGARARWGAAPRAAFWAAAAAAFAVCVLFCRPWWSDGRAWAGLAAVAAALTAGADAGEEFWPLAAGFSAVFFADSWGTTNGCWAYYLAARPGGVWQGVGFGMAFDAAVVLGSLRLARALKP